MGFFDPEVSKPYSSLISGYPDVSGLVDTDAMNRARQFSAQSAAARGSGGSTRGPALNSYNRMMSDYNINRAQTDFTNRLNWNNSQAGIMGKPGAITPSTLSTLGSMGGTVGGAILKEAAPDIWKKMKWWDSSPKDLTAQYNAIGGQGVVPSAGMDTSQYGYNSPVSMSVQDAVPDAYSSLTSGYGSYGGPDVGTFSPGDYGGSVPDFSSAYQAVDSVPSFTESLNPEDISNLFDTGFIGW